ncbi:MAG: methylenetetrahydrofolate reductase [Clostridia bacterium]|nr:methylenetetrahydrofolate reductase [NAD(P)H] [Clostridia bacterium]
MKLDNIFDNKQVFSLEVFPPKRDMPIDTIYKTLDELSEIKPAFISVTYGAGGSENCAATLEIASTIKNKYGIEAVAHLPGINLTKADVVNMLDDFKKNGIQNILALRGDGNPETEPVGDFNHADELVRFIKEHGDFHVAGACYPEGHAESENLITDIKYLRQKVDAGCDHLISQLFFDNDHFYRFRERCDLAGINVPIEAGIMPVLNKKQIERMVTMCGASLPNKFVKMMARYENNPEALKDAAIAYAVDQIVDLVSQGVDGIHLYTMNKPDTAKRIYSCVASLFKC